MIASGKAGQPVNCCYQCLANLPPSQSAADRQQPPIPCPIHGHPSEIDADLLDAVEIYHDSEEQAILYETDNGHHVVLDRRVVDVLFDWYGIPVSRRRETFEYLTWIHEEKYGKSRG